MIAKATGFTQSTVSKALHSTGRISEKTTEIIRRTANEMGYYSQNRQNLRRSESHLFPQIAVLVPEISSWHYADLVERLQGQIERLGGSLCVFITGFLPGKSLLLIENLNRQNQFDGIILLDYPHPSMTSDVPLIILTSEEDFRPTENQYVIRYDSGMDLIAEHLTKLGHRRIGFLGETNTAAALNQFCRVLRKRRIPVDPDLFYVSQYRFERIGHDGVAVQQHREPVLRIRAALTVEPHGGDPARRPRHDVKVRRLRLRGLQKLVLRVEGDGIGRAVLIRLEIAASLQLLPAALEGFFPGAAPAEQKALGDGAVRQRDPALDPDVEAQRLFAQGFVPRDGVLYDGKALFDPKRLRQRRHLLSPGIPNQA